MVSRRRIGLSPASFRSVEGTERNGASEITETGVRNGSTTIRFDSAVVDFADLLKVEIPTVGRNGRHKHVLHSLVFDHLASFGAHFAARVGTPPSPCSGPWRRVLGKRPPQVPQ